MSHIPQITFRRIQHSHAVENAILKRMEKIEGSYRGLGQWYVVVDSPHRHHQQGNHFHVRVCLSVRGTPILVGHPHSKRQATEDIFDAVHGTFDAVERRIRGMEGKRQAKRARLGREKHYPKELLWA